MRPTKFVQGSKIVGMEPDLMNALGKVMGLKVTITKRHVRRHHHRHGRRPLHAWRLLVHRREVAREVGQLSSITQTSGESFYTLKSGGTNIKGISSICGLTVSVETGTTEEHDAKAQSTKCTKAGKKAVNTTPYPTQTCRQPGSLLGPRAARFR